MRQERAAWGDQTTTHTQTQSSIHKHTHSSACLYIQSQTHTYAERHKKAIHPPPTALINKGQLAIIISIFNQSPVVLLCGLSSDNWLSPSLSVCLSLPLSLLPSLFLFCFMSRSSTLPISYVINIWASLPSPPPPLPAPPFLPCHPSILPSPFSLSLTLFFLYLSSLTPSLSLSLMNASPH